MRWLAVMVVSLTIAAACSPSEGPESIPLPTSPDTTTTTSTTPSTSVPAETTIPPTTEPPEEPPEFEATIRRTTDGVPHVRAETRKSLFFGQGWASAQDSGCNLIDQVIKIRGERALNLGPGETGENVESDLAWQVIGIFDIASRDFDEAPPEIVEMFDSFVTGWNAYLEESGEAGLPGWCADAEWVRPIQPVEAYAYARSITLLASSARLAPSIAVAEPPEPGEAPAEPAPPPAEETEQGSNAWAVGRDRVEGGSGGLLVANPHSPWEGELRFGEIHLTVPDDIDIYGAQLSGVPAIGIGFTSEVAWAHTASAGHRFTAYRLRLDPESPTTYFVDDQPTEMTATEHEVEILRPDGSIDTEVRTLYSTEYGPVIELPGLEWTAETAIAFRDANLDNDEYITQTHDLLDVAGLGDLVATHERHQGSPMFNTIATGRDGRVWYADPSASPNLSAQAERFFLTSVDTDPQVRAAWEMDVLLLDGSDSRFRWRNDEGARDPGLVPWDGMPMVERTDYLFNANDSFWAPSAEFTLDGPFSIVHGEQRTPLSMRTRQNAAVLESSDPLGLAGNDGLFSGGELRRAAFDNTSQNALLLKDAAVAACRFIPVVPVQPLVDAEGVEIAPAGAIDLTSACDVLDAWDGRYDLDRAGAVLWREVMSQFTERERTRTGVLFADPFDPADPTHTPSQPNPDLLPLLGALARAVQLVEASGFAADSTLGAAQFTERSADRIAVHGGQEVDGVTNIVALGDLGTSTEPLPASGETIAPWSSLHGSGYPVNSGTSFAMMVDFTGGEPEGFAMLTSGQTIDRTSELFDQQAIRFSDKNWRPVAFREIEILADVNLTEETVSAG